MDIKWKNYSRAITTKIMAFVIAITTFSAAVAIFGNIIVLGHGKLDIAVEQSYYLSEDFLTDSSRIVQDLRAITEKFKSEEFILSGGSVTEAEIAAKEDQLFRDFKYNSKRFNPKLSEAENYEIFKESYADRILQAREELIQQHLRDYRQTLRRINEYKGLYYHAKSGETVFTNAHGHTQDYFKTFPSYMIFDSSEQTVFPTEITSNRYYHWIIPSISNEMKSGDAVYIGLAEEYLNPKMAEWQDSKDLITNNLKGVAGLLLVFAAAFVLLVLVIGRKPEDDQKIHLTTIDRIYNDLNLAMCFVLIGVWCGSVSALSGFEALDKILFLITLLIAAPGLLLVLSLVKHIKNHTFIKHTLTYNIFYHLVRFVKEVSNSGSLAVKVVLIVILYPIIATLTFFMFPITLGAAAWLALKKVKEYNTITEGVKQVKEGNYSYTIDIPGDGEFARLAADINTITDGLNKSVESQIKSERLKSELITNVSHDIRTPLTSIITYVDLLKKETDPDKSKEYLDIIDQKSQRLKILTDDLFEVTKASSGNVPVNYEKIDLLSLITQGLGEFDDQIKERRLDFRLSHPGDKVFIEADGKLLWRTLENLLLNIFKYALEGSRVYIDIVEADEKIKLIIKNISAYELNVSPEELMERFKRGDMARTSQGSGLGLSIAKSLIELQKGNFYIEVDGDLFKAIIEMPSPS
ncbi:MAG: sensor histidine kinase [Syntrophomonadaceae bacterium]|nr:sensor histidine kinase [Syntrophomonadaceae bacterium]